MELNYNKSMYMVLRMHWRFHFSPLWMPLVLFNWVSGCDLPPEAPRAVDLQHTPSTMLMSKESQSNLSWFFYSLHQENGRRRASAGCLVVLVKLLTTVCIFPYLPRARVRRHNNESDTLGVNSQVTEATATWRKSILLHKVLLNRTRWFN